MTRPLSKPRELDPAGSDFPEEIRSEVLRLLGQPQGMRAAADFLERSAGRVPIEALAFSAIKLRAAAPMDRAVWAATDNLVYSLVPKWHWQMLQDQARARAYLNAIQASVRPGMLALEIGAGTGVLAMMAARAGAEHVYTVEANPLMAEIARECVAKNGYADKVTVIAKHSSEVIVGRDLPRRADLLVHEILSSTILTEGLAPTIHHALAELLTEEAPLLPELIGIEAVLSEDVTVGGAPWWSVEGFDLAPLAYLDAAAHGVSGAAKRRRLSQPVGVAQIDLRSAELMTARGFAGPLIADRAGVVSGVEQWMKVCFPGGIVLSSDDPQSHWGTSYHPFAASRELAPGDRVDIEIALDSRNLSIGLALGDSRPPPDWSSGL